MGKYVLYGGKGGVGKTTCAAASGLKTASQGHRTLLVSTDPAHSLGDVLETDVGSDPTQVQANLWGVEADPEAGQAVYQRIVETLAAEFRSAGLRMTETDVEQLFAAGFVPGSDEVAALEYFLAYDDDGWDRIVFDTAPTGHTLRLLTLPDVLSESLSTATKVQGEVRRLVASARSFVMGPAAFLGNDDEGEIEALRDRMDRVAELLRDERQTDFRVVLLPERLALEETRRLLERLESFDIPVETLIVNRVYETPPTACDQCQERAAAHEATLDRIRRTYPDMDVHVLPDLGAEVSGREGLERLADRLPK
ncbi:ArsA family ATPase [Halorientalis salina]|uniref:ArsA family ATPase n=1 Tax=Halorientalis salina TaxID=2932266 RepID=UPI0010ABBD88|nr:ArsA family ATPase [Halorientalis salina]